LFRDGKRLALRGRPDVALPPALLSCFEYSLIHISDDRRRGADYTPPAGVSRRIPFIITGVQTRICMSWRRFTRVDVKTLLYRFTIEDSNTWDKPWTGEYAWPATDQPIYEYACHEAN